MTALLLLALTARADDASALTTWSESAVELTPDLDGGTWGRARQQIQLEAKSGPGSLDLDAAFQLPPGGQEAAEFEVHQAAYSLRTGYGLLSVGRQIRLDPRGWLPFDGVAFDAEGTTFVRPAVLAGRLWSVEPGEEGHGTWLGGFGFRIRPPNGKGEASRAVAFTAGWLGRVGDAGLSHDLAAGAGWRNPKGANAALDAELRVGAERGSRADLRAYLPVGSHLALAPELRWEDLSPVGEVSGLRTPMDWLGGEGYGAASLAFDVNAGDIHFQANGGPVMHRDEAGLGGLGRGSLGWQGDGANAAIFGSAAAIGGSWVAGGGLEGGLALDRVDLDATAGLFRFQPLSQAAANVGEVRLRGTTPLIADSDAGALDLSVEVAAGADRLLQPWARAGILLQGRLNDGGGR